MLGLGLALSRYGIALDAVGRVASKDANYLHPFSGLLVISVLERHASKDASNRKATEFRPGNCHPVFLRSVPPQMKTVENHSG